MGINAQASTLNPTSALLIAFQHVFTVVFTTVNRFTVVFTIVFTTVNRFRAVNPFTTVNPLDPYSPSIYIGVRWLRRN